MCACVHSMMIFGLTGFELNAQYELTRKPHMTPFESITITSDAPLLAVECLVERKRKKKLFICIHMPTRWNFREIQFNFTKLAFTEWTSAPLSWTQLPGLSYDLISNGRALTRLHIPTKPRSHTLSQHTLWRFVRFYHYCHQFGVEISINYFTHSPFP
jgi:hypothetical protein